jgi:predicted Zn-dependent protease
MDRRTWVDQVAKSVGPGAPFFSLRHVRRRDERVTVRGGVVEPPTLLLDEGLMITVATKAGVGYSSTSDLSEAGIVRAAERAKFWALQSSTLGALDWSQFPFEHPRGHRRTAVRKFWKDSSLRQRIDRLLAADDELKRSQYIVDRMASLWNSEVTCTYLTNHGGEVEQSINWLVPMMYACAARGSVIENRSFGGSGYARQGGLEVLDDLKFDAAAPQIREDALALAAAPHCPTAEMDLLLDPDQMILQIHESIGHPLELDRILGDERNFAGTSFVTKDMFGRYQYGSDLLNITFDPTIDHELASYDFDDEGTRAEKAYLIRNGVLLRPLGGAVSQHRSGMPGVANARADSWNRPPIDRMANLNLEPGESSLESMIASVERGVYMKTNCSWSIDDSRNKFQFGCEWARLIENGQLTSLVRKPNYRGISATFWRSLKAVGDRRSNQVLGTPYCGKGEPNQVITVGHATPACLFADVQVFGGV